MNLFRGLVQLKIDPRISFTRRRCHI